MKELHFPVRALNKIDEKPRHCIFGVCNKFIRKMTDYFFIILDLGTASIGNESLFTQLKENAALIKKIGPMYIDFDEYPTYSDTIYEVFETNINANIQCEHDYSYSSSEKKMCSWVNGESWEILKLCFPDAKQIQNAHKQQYAKNAHMLKEIEIKLMRILIPHQIMNIPFQQHIFMKNL